MQYVDIGWEGAPYRERFNQMIVRGGDGRTHYPHQFQTRYVDTSRQYAPWGEHRLQGVGAMPSAARSAMQARPALLQSLYTGGEVRAGGGLLDTLPWWTWIAVPMVIGGVGLFAWDQGWFGK